MSKYTDPVKQINAAFFNAYGRNATKAEIQHWQNKPTEALRDQLMKPEAGARKGSYYNPTPNVTPETTTETPTNLPMTYDEWLKSPGQQYADRYAPENLEKEYGPYYAQLLGGAQNEKTVATDIYNTNVDRTTTNVGESSNEAGLYGSGIYQKELGQALGDLSKNYENTWGTGQYTPYSLRLSQIEQQKKEAIANAGITRQGQAWDVYQQQYYPLLNQ